VSNDLRVGVMDKTGVWQCKTSYLDPAVEKRDAIRDETAGAVEADKTLGAAACGSDKSAVPFAHSSIPNGNLGAASLRCKPAYEDGQDE
jgi:hypothetical protein